MPQKDPSSRSALAASAAFDRHAAAITVLTNAMFLRHLVAVYRAFDGDVVEAIVLGEIAHHNVSHLSSRARTPRELSESLNSVDPDHHARLLPTNSFSIAQATGIPRETVRRKVVSLLRRGWLMKDAAGNLSFSSTVAGVFREHNFQRTLDLLEVARAVETLLPGRRPTRKPKTGSKPSARGAAPKAK